MSSLLRSSSTQRDSRMEKRWAANWLQSLTLPGSNCVLFFVCLFEL